jgi:hypothetical protein
MTDEPAVRAEGALDALVDSDAPGWGADAPGWDADAREIDVGAAVEVGRRRSVGLTAVGILGVVFLAAVGAGVYLVYRHESQQAHRYKAQVAGLRAQLAAADKRASGAFVRGMTAKAKIDKTLGGTYIGGFQAGWAAVFGGFPSWRDGGWYLVKIGHGETGHEIRLRAEVAPCQRVYVSNDQIYRQGVAC